MILGVTFNTKRPSNVDDEDLDPESTYPISPKIGFTAMTFCVINHEMWWLNQQCNIIVPDFPGDDPGHLKSASFEEKVRVLSDFAKHLEEEYLVHLDTRNPLAWITKMVSHLVLKRYWLAAYHPLRQEKRATHNEGVKRDRLLFTAVEIMEDAHRLESEPTTAQYEWFLKSWVQWHALAVALAELCVQNQGPLVQRAWNIIDTVFEPWAAHIADSRRGMLWRPIQKLNAKARRNRLGGSMIIDSGSTAPNQQVMDQDSRPMQPQPQLQPILYDTQQSPNLLTNSPHTYVDPVGSLQRLAVGNLTLEPLGPTQPAVMPQILPERAPQMMSVLTSPLKSSGGLSGGLGESMVGESMGTINWAEWDEFMQDFEMENRPTGDGEFVQQDGKAWGLWF